MASRRAAEPEPAAGGAPERPELSETVEDYLRLILTLHAEDRLATVGRISTSLAVTPASVSGTVRRLMREGLLYLDRQHLVQLTPLGDVAARTVWRRHGLAERFLVDILKVPFAEASLHADRFEHTISPRIERQLEKLLGNPGSCPHGNPINQPRLAEATLPLPLAKRGPAVVRHLRESSGSKVELMQRLEASNLLPGSQIEVVDILDGAVRLRAGACEYELPASIAEVVMVVPD